jgi:hypothetical protein
MEKIDRLGWTAGITLRAYGVSVGVRTNDQGLMGEILDCLPPGWRHAKNPKVEVIYSLIRGGESATGKIRHFNMLYFNGSRLARTMKLERVLEIFESSIRLYVSENSSRRVFVHAGAVGWRGQAIIIPGRSFSGKTTLVRELVRAGATYYSDEYAVLDRHGHVHPYVKPLSIRENGAVSQTNYSVEDLGGRSGVKPLPVRLVIITTYRHGARWRPVRLSGGMGALEILANTVPARRQPQASMAALQRVVSGAAIYKSPRGEATEIVDSILSHLDAR